MPLFLELEIPPLATTCALLIKNYVTASSKNFQVFSMSSYPIPITTIIFFIFQRLQLEYMCIFMYIYIYIYTHLCAR